MHAQPTSSEPTQEELLRLGALASAFEVLAEDIQESINSRPQVGTPGSSYSLDLEPSKLDERSLMTVGLPGALGLLQAVRGNARALWCLYATAGPPLIDPAPFELMRGMWEKSLLACWLLDNQIPSNERLGRIKGWLEAGLRRTGETFKEDTQGLIREMLAECPSPGVRPPSWTALSTSYSENGVAIYKELSGLLHGRVWSNIAAFDRKCDEGGSSVAWRGYPLALHCKLASQTENAARSAMSTVRGYFGVG